MRLRAELTLEQAGKLLKMPITTLWRKETGVHRIPYAEGIGIRVLFERHAARRR